jgi:antitoxin (DNA-binding transcriptional repressor) of toxin-antitoxin stability system
MPTIINATEANRTLSSILSKVHYCGESFEVRRGAKIIAKIIPVDKENKGISAKELNELCRNLPQLDKDDIDDFEQNIKEMRAKSQTETTLWE